MKEFKKWAGCGYMYGPVGNRPLLEAKQEAWKAALEWVLEKADHGFCQCGCIEDSITKELDFSKEENEGYELWGRRWKQKMEEKWATFRASHTIYTTPFWMGGLAKALDLAIKKLVFNRPLNYIPIKEKDDTSS